MKPATFLPSVLAAVFLLAVSCGPPPSEDDSPTGGSPEKGASKSSSTSEGSEAAAETTSAQATAEEATSSPGTTAAKSVAGGAKGERTANRGAERASKPSREPAPVDEVVEVEIRGLEYLPGPVEVSPGTTVRWTNEEQALHTVTSEGSDGPLRSAELAKGEPYEQTFRRPGQYDYYCAVHPFMKSGVTVE